MALSPDFPRYPLLFGPSPVHPLERLTAHLGGAQIWAKREDCNSGLAYGGNKTRKLEYLVPDALAQGADTLVSIGGYQSNHTRQVAAVAAQARAEGACWCRRTGSTGRTPSTTGSATSCCRRIMGAEVRLDPAGFGIGFKDSLAAGASTTSRPRAARRTRSRPAPPTTGWAASGSRMGRRGRSSRRRELGVFFDTIIVCTVTGSTHAGMIAGFAGQDRPRRVIGIDASRQDRRDPRRRSSGSPGTPRSSSGSAATCATTRSPCWRAGPATSTASRSPRRSTRSG